MPYYRRITSDFCKFLKNNASASLDVEIHTADNGILKHNSVILNPQFLRDFKTIFVHKNKDNSAVVYP